MIIDCEFGPVDFGSAAHGCHACRCRLGSVLRWDSGRSRITSCFTSPVTYHSRKSTCLKLVLYCCADLLELCCLEVMRQAEAIWMSVMGDHHVWSTVEDTFERYRGDFGFLVFDSSFAGTSSSLT